VLLVTISAACAREPTAVDDLTRRSSSEQLSNETVPDTTRFIVVLREEARSRRGVLDELTLGMGNRVRHRFNSLFLGFAANLSNVEVQALRRNPLVATVQQDALVFQDEVDINAGWALGRIDQRAGPSDHQFEYSLSGQGGVNLYIIDSGVDSAHADFTGRVRRGWTWDSQFPAITDCSGHGSAVASVAAGQEFGVAKGAKVWSVRINDCDDVTYRSSLIAGIEWVQTNHVKPAIANISWSLPAWLDGLLPGSVHHAAVSLLSSGVLVVVSAGNQATSACDRSPANAYELMTVAATNANDERAAFSNYGCSVDLFAPGENVDAAQTGGGFVSVSGTSYSAPLTAGVAALLYAKYPADSPQQIHYAIRDGATTGVVGNPLSANLLLYSRLPAPVKTEILGLDVVPSGALCTWHSQIRAGRAPFTIQWSGMFTETTASVTGTPYSSGSLLLEVWDSLGGYAYAVKSVQVETVDPPPFVCE
jgi:subtilisin family serine protease